MATGRHVSLRIDAAVWKAAKLRAVEEGVAISTVVEGVLRDWVGRRARDPVAAVMADQVREAKWAAIKEEALAGRECSRSSSAQ